MLGDNCQLFVYFSIVYLRLLIPAQKIERHTICSGLLNSGTFDATASITMRNINCISVQKVMVHISYLQLRLKEVRVDMYLMD